MIAKKYENEKQNFEIAGRFTTAMKELKISSLLKRSNIRKESRNTKSGDCSKRSAFEIFQFLILLVFKGCNPVPFSGIQENGYGMLQEHLLPFLE